MRKRTKATPISVSAMRSKRARKTRYLGVTATVLFVSLMGLVFFGSGLYGRLLRMPNVAAVVEAVLVELANQDRTIRGVETLKTNPILVAAAQAKANDMAAKGYFAHTAPDGADPWHWFAKAGYAFDYAGENLAVDFSDSADVNTAWMNSPEHRKNILDPHYTEIGIATAQGVLDGRATIFVVQEFGAPASSRQKPVVAATVPKEPTKLATASAAPAQPHVLGSASSKSETPPVMVVPASTSIQVPIAQSFAIATTEPTVAAQMAYTSTPVWGFLVAFPRTTLRYLFYGIALLILIALGLETEMEFHWRHREHAIRAGSLLLALILVFVFANVLYFGPPVIALAQGV